MTAFTPAVVLLDADLPGVTGADGVAAIQRLSPSTKIIFLSKSLTEVVSSLIEELSRLAEQLKEELLRRKEELSRPAGDQTEAADAARNGRLNNLTVRQGEIVRLLTGGYSNKEIASQLGVAEKTVKAHLTSVFRKLGLSNRLQLALLVSEQTRAS